MVLPLISYYINLGQSTQGKLVDQFKPTTPIRKVILNACEAERAEVTFYLKKHSESVKLLHQNNVPII